MKKVFLLISLAIVLGLVLVGCPQPNDSGNGGGGETVYVKPADETIFVDVGNTIPMRIIGIKGGTFMMGSTTEEVTAGTAGDDEDPEHPVTLNSFYLGSTEVTEAQWEAVMTDWPGADDPATGESHPARHISWYDAIRFCNKLSKSEGLNEVYYVGDEYNDTTTGKVTDADSIFAESSVKMDITKSGYRLPTEAEWEYAAGGAQETPTTYAGTDDKDSLASYAVYGTGDPSTVGSKSPVSSEYALYDMSGNVSEWCWDWYDANYYSAENNTDNPIGLDSGSIRVFRGGYWSSDASQCRVADRNGDFHPSNRDGGIGFRVARSVE